MASDKDSTTLIPDQNLKNVEFDLSRMTRDDINILLGQLQRLHTMFQETTVEHGSEVVEAIAGQNQQALSRFGHEFATEGYPHEIEPEKVRAVEASLSQSWKRAKAAVQTGLNRANLVMSRMVQAGKILPSHQAGTPQDKARDDQVKVFRQVSTDRDEAVSTDQTGEGTVGGGRGSAHEKLLSDINAELVRIKGLSADDRRSLEYTAKQKLEEARRRVLQGQLVATEDGYPTTVEQDIAEAVLAIQRFEKERSDRPTIAQVRATDFPERFRVALNNQIEVAGRPTTADGMVPLVVQAANEALNQVRAAADAPEFEKNDEIIDSQLVLSTAASYLQKAGGLGNNARNRITRELGLAAVEKSYLTSEALAAPDTKEQTAQWSVTFTEQFEKLREQAAVTTPGGLAALQGDPEGVLDLLSRAANLANALVHPSLPKGVDITSVSNTALIEHEAHSLLARGLDRETQAEIRARYGDPQVGMGVTATSDGPEVFTQEQTIRTAWMGAFSADFNERIADQGRDKDARAELRKDPALVQRLAKLAASTASSKIRGSNPEYRNLKDAEMVNMDYMLGEVEAQLNEGLTPEMKSDLESAFGLTSSMNASGDRLAAARSVKDGLAKKIGDPNYPMTAQEAERIFGHLTNTLRQLDDDGRPLDREHSAQEVELLRGFEGLTVDQAQKHAASIIDTRAAIREAEREKENQMFTRAQGLEAAEESRTRYGREEQMGVRTDIRDMQQKQQEQTTGIHRAVAAAQQQMASEYLSQAPQFGPVTPGAKIGGANIYEQLAGSRGIVDPGYLEYGGAVPSMPQASDMQAFHEALASARAKLAYGTEEETLTGLPEYTPQPGLSTRDPAVAGWKSPEVI